MKILLSALCLFCLVPRIGAQDGGAQDGGAQDAGAQDAGAQPAPVPPAAAQDTGKIPQIQLEGDFYVLHFSENPTEQLNLEEFVLLCQEATGLNFTYNDQTQAVLRQGKLVMFGTKRVPKKDFYAFFQIQMFINDFVCVEVGPPHISVILIQSLQQGQRGAANIRQKAINVAPENLESYADQPATLITTVLYLPNTEVRQLSTSLRALLTDQNTQTMLPAGEHSVILQGFGSYVASLARLLQIVDAESAIESEILPVFEVIPLEFAAAEDVSALLEELLDQLRRTAADVRNRRRAVAVEGQGVSAPLQTGEIETAILVDHRTNSLLVMAMPEEMPRIKDLIARLDVDVPDPERNFHIYSLDNVKAEDISEVLDDFLSDADRVSRSAAQGATGGQAQPSPTPAATSSSRSNNNQVVVVPDPGSNSLLIAANKTRYEEILELVRQLDRRQDQVLIESALIELTGSDILDLGVEFAFADTTGDGGFGATAFGLSSIIDSDMDGIPDTRIPNVPSGIVGGIISGDDVNIPFLVAAAKNVSGANVLNIPSVLVNNNGAAHVVTKDEQPTTTVTATGVGTNQENFNTYVEAGITMDISPSISAARYLRLDISVVVSNFTASFASSTIPPPRITREIKTQVNVPDGDTMVIGGVISDIQRDSRDAVPWLGELPLIGALFRRDTSSSNRTTLYFFVTPHILRDRDFADLAEISYQKKLQAAEVMGKDRLRVVDPDFGGEGKGIDFDLFEVPLYRSPERGEVEGSDVGIDALKRQELMEGKEP
jgi:type II secretion system protein D